MSRASDKSQTGARRTAVGFEMGDRARVCADPAFAGLHTMLASFEQHCFPPHVHDELMIGTIQEGVQSFLRDKKKHFAPRESMSIINPGDVHTGEPAYNERLVYRALYIPVKVLQDAQAALRISGPLSGFPSAVIHDRRLWLAVEQYHDALESGELAIVREFHMYGALEILLREYTGELNAGRTSYHGRQEACRMREMLHSLRDSRPTIRDLANTVGLDTFQAIRVFRDTFDVTPHAYLLALKIQRAKTLIQIGMPICEVAIQAGFVDQAHLHRHFKRMTGVTPGCYRNASRSSIPKQVTTSRSR